MQVPGGTMPIHELAGKPAPHYILTNIPRLISAYYTYLPDYEIPTQRISFGTSGHRGRLAGHSFNEPHVLSICQAICEHRQARGSPGRCSSAWTPMPYRSRPLLPPWRYSPPMGSRFGWTRISAIRRLRSSRGRSWCTTATTRPSPPTGSSLPPRTTRPATAALSTTHPRADRPTPRPPAPSRTGPTRSWRRG
jgi:hypothetical protein